MEIVASLTEQTTAATDLILGLLTIGFALYLGRFHPKDPFRTRLWQALMLLSSFVALAGTVAHGIVMPKETYELLWKPMLICLGLVVAFFVLAAVYDLKGRTAAKKLLPWCIGAALVFFGIIHIPGSSFLYFILYEIAGMVFALGVYGYLGAKKQFPGAYLILSGIVLQIVAAGVQASGPWQLRLIWLFDHNGIFHLIGMPALFIMVAGIARGFRRARI